MRAGPRSNSEPPSGFRRSCPFWGICLALAVATPAASLSIEVLRGESANNNAAQHLGAASVVRVLDAKGSPVANALVVFTGPDKGPTILFAGQGPSAQTLTDESGIAGAPRERPVGDGPVDIRVMANVGRDFANTVIHQMNIGTMGAQDRDRVLSLIRLPRGLDGMSDSRALRIRVEDGAGRPVPSATVAFVLRRDRQELTRTVVTSDRNGEAAGEVPGQYRRLQLEFVVQADSEGRRVTDFFQLDNK